MKKALFLLLVFIFLLSGCRLEPISDHTFTKEGVTITLPSDFVEYESERWELYCANNEYTFMSKRQIRSKDEYKLLTAKTYMQYVLASYDLDVTIRCVDGYNEVFYYCYYNTYKDDTPEYGYMMMVFESDDYFYIMNFASNYEIFEDSKALFLQYALTISVK